MTLLIIAFVLAVGAHFLDREYQADSKPGWRLLWLERGVRGDRDSLSPFKDAWHTVQLFRNLLWKTTPVGLFVGASLVVYGRLTALMDVWPMLVCVAVVIALDGVARLLGFSLVNRLLGTYD